MAVSLHLTLSYGEPLHETPSVGAANYPGARVAARHLLELGHRRIAMLAGNTPSRSRVVAHATTRPAPRTCCGTTPSPTS